MGEELKQLSLLNLRDLAKSKGMKNISKLNKDELIKLKGKFFKLWQIELKNKGRKNV